MPPTRLTQIVNVIRVHFADCNLFTMTLRALGNLSYCDENIHYLVESGAVECIVQGMLANSADKQATQYSLEVWYPVKGAYGFSSECARRGSLARSQRMS